MEELSVGSFVEHERYGEGMVAKVNLTNYDVYFAHGGKVSISKNSDQFTVVTCAENKSGASQMNDPGASPEVSVD